MNLRQASLRSLILLTVALLSVVTVSHLTADPASEPTLQSYTGTLKTGVMAIGAETTGYTLTTAADGIYELQFKDPKLKAQADAMDGRNIIVEGIYKPRPGVEVKERRIIDVQKLTGN